MIQQCHHAQSLSRVWFFATPWTIAHKDPLFTGFSKQEYWRGLLFPSGNAISGYILKGNKNRILKRHLPSHVTVVLLIIAKIWKQAVDRLMNNREFIYYVHVCVCIYIHTHTHAHIHVKYYLAMKMKEILGIVSTWMKLKVTMLKEKDK